MKYLAKRSLVIAVFLSIFIPTATTAQAAGELTLDRLFSTGDFFGDGFGPARWLDDGRYTTVEASPSGSGRDIVAYRANTGDREVLVSSEQLTPRGSDTPLGIANYIWSDDDSRLLIFTNTRRVWRANTKGDYWVLDLDDHELFQVGGDAPEATLMFAKFSPDGSRVGYVQEHDLYVQNLETRAITRLTFDGSTTTINGTFDWVYEEELFLRDGFRWSPDGENIAFWQLDATGVRDFLLVNNTDSLYSFVTPVQYPKAGETNSAGRVGVISASGGEPVWMQLDGDPRNNYIARMDWAASSDEIVIQYLNRRQNNNRVMLGDVSNGRVRTVLTETDSAWVDIGNDLRWLDNGSRFTWVSERDGWRRVYVASRDDGRLTPVTPANTDIMSVQLVDEANGWVYYIASPENPTQRYLFRSRLNGRGSAERLSPANQPGTHSYQISPDGRWAFHTYSTFGTPAQIALVQLPDHESVQTLVTNDRLRSTISALTLGETEFFRVEVEPGVELDGWMIKPSDFDPTRKYPVLFFVYGEPWSQTVLDRWGGRTMLWHHYVAEQGYIVMSLDNRGTPAPRGRDWRKVVYGEIGTLASQDQANGARAIAATYRFVDAERLAIWGWSGGGSMTLNAMFRHPDVYQTGMSVAPVPDQRYYDTIYQERYMGTPQNNPEGYRLGSPITYANQLEGNLLLVHGTGDDNVHYQGTEALINRLIEFNKDFTMMSYPNRSHGIFEGRGTTRHLYGLLTRYLRENLRPGGERGTV